MSEDDQFRSGPHTAGHLTNHFDTERFRTKSWAMHPGCQGKTPFHQLLNSFGAPFWGVGSIFLYHNMSLDESSVNCAVICRYVSIVNFPAFLTAF